MTYTHATANAYTKHGCRCEACKVFMRAYWADIRARTKSKPVKEHGNYTSYASYGCRCSLCKDANLAYTKDYRARKRSSPVKEHGTRTSYVLQGCRCPLCVIGFNGRDYQYGLPQGSLLRMIDSQSGACAICAQELDGRAWHVDHNHTTGAVRGVLCVRCNVGLGKLRDSPGNIRSAISYLTPE